MWVFFICLMLGLFFDFNLKNNNNNKKINNNN